MIRLAFVSDAIYPYNKGGKEKRIFEITTRLAARGMHVTIYTMKWWVGKNTICENGVFLHAISPLIPLYSGERRSIKEAVLFALSCFSLLFENFDILDVDHMPHLIIFPLKIIAILKGKKLIVSWNEVWGRSYWVSYLGTFGILAAFIEKMSAYLPDKVISISLHTTALFKKLLNKTTSITTIACGVDTKKIAGILPAKKNYTLIFAGRLLVNKHVDVLINTVALLKKSLPNIRCLIIGDGPEKNKLISLIREKKLEDTITLQNFVPKEEDLYALFKSSKILVLPSTREGFGLVVLEANACGIPVITTNAPDNAAKDLIKEGVNGYTSTLSVIGFSEKITLLLKKSISKEKITSYVKSYDWEEIVTQIERVYKA